jgi:hypothetical protein
MSCGYTSSIFVMSHVRASAIWLRCRPLWRVTTFAILSRFGAQQREPGRELFKSLAQRPPQVAGMCPSIIRQPPTRLAVSVSQEGARRRPSWRGGLQSVLDFRTHNWTALITRNLQRFASRCERGVRTCRSGGKVCDHDLKNTTGKTSYGHGNNPSFSSRQQRLNVRWQMFRVA